MKKILLLVIFLIIPLLALAQNPDTTWLIKGRYIEHSIDIGKIERIKYSKDGNFIYTFNEYKFMQKWDVNTGKLVKEKYCGGMDADIDTETEHIYIGFPATGGYYTKKIDFNSAKEFYNTEVINSSASITDIKIILSPDASEFVMAGCWESTSFHSGNIDLRKSATGEHIHTFKSDFIHKVYNNYSGWLVDFAFSNDMQNYIFSSVAGLSYYNVWIDNKCLYLLDKNFNSAHLKDEKGKGIYYPEISALEFSKERRFIAGKVAWYDIYIWNIEDGSLFNKFPSGFDYIDYSVDDLKIDLNNQYVITASEKRDLRTDKRNGAFCLWEIATGRLIENINLPDSNYNWILDASPNGKSFAVGSSDGHIRIYSPLYLANILHADFIADSTVKVLGNPIIFTDKSLGEPTSWKWNFGDGTESYLQNPTHLYTKSGVYTVTLIVRKASKIDTIVKQEYIRITEPLSADFIAEPLVGKAPLAVQFFDKSKGDINSWYWEFGNGSISTEKNPSHTFIDPIAYNIRLQVSDGYFTSSIEKPQYIVVDRGLPENINIKHEQEYSYNGLSSYGYKVIECKQGGYLVVAMVKVNYEYYSYLIRFDEKLNIKWTSFINFEPYTKNIIQLSDGNYIIGNVLGGEEKTLSFKKIDDDAHILWGNTFEFADHCTLHDLTATKDGGFIAVGFLIKTNPIFIKKYNSDGISEWDSSYYSTTQSYNSIKIISSNDDDYVISGYSSKIYAYRTLKINQIGDIIWEKYCYINNIREFFDFKQTNEGKYIFVSSEEIAPGVLSKYYRGCIYFLDFDGDIENNYMNPNDSSLYYALTQVNDSVFSITGKLINKIGFQLFDTKANFLEEYIFQDKKGDINSMIFTRDKCLLLVGTVYPLDENPRVYVLKLKLDERYVSVQPEPSLASDLQLSVVPNPVSQVATINYELSQSANIKLAIYNSLGQEIATLIDGLSYAGKHEVVFDGKSLPSGMYYCVLRTGNNIKTCPFVVFE